MSGPGSPSCTSAAFLLLLNFGPYIFYFLVKFVSPSSSMTKISPGQCSDNTRTSCLSLWILIALHKCTLRTSGYSPFDILYRRPPPVIRKLKGDHQQPADLEMSQYLWILGKVLHRIAWETLERTPIPWGNWVHPNQPGDEVWIKDRKKQPRQQVGTGPHTVVLATPTAVKVTGIIPWIHHIRVKKAVASCNEYT